MTSVNEQTLQDKVNELSYKIDILTAQLQNHRHNNIQSLGVNLSDIVGMFETVSTAPTLTPTKASEQIKIYKNSTTYRIYWYDNIGHTWYYATGT